MKKFFHPNSLVVFGASQNAENFGHTTIRNLHAFGYQGRVYAIGRSGGTAGGVPILSSVAELPEAPDLAVVLTSARTVPEVMRECGEKGIRRAVIMSAGFAELGPERMPLQQELLEVAQRYGMRFIGPNCLGIISPENGLVLPFAVLQPETLRAGGFSFLSQSGGFCLATALAVTYAGAGIGKAASIGNKLNVDEVDLLPYLIEEDAATKVIGLYLEGMKRGREFVELARKSAKPLVVLKANVSAASGSAARSHTASIASDDRIVGGAFRQAGIVRIREVRRFTTAAKALGLPPLRGNRLAIGSAGGGGGVVASDWCLRNGFQLPALPEAVKTELRSRARSGVVNHNNPMDLADTAGNDAILQAVEVLLASPDIDGLVLALIYFKAHASPDAEACEVIERVRAIMRRFDKPIAMSFPFGAEPAVSVRLRELSGFALFDDVDESLEGFAMLREFSRHRQKPLEAPIPLDVDREGARELIAKARRKGMRDIGPAAMDVLARYGLPVAPLYFAADVEQALRRAHDLGYPVAMKAVARELAHKSDVGGVVLGIANDEALRRAFSEIRDAIRRSGAEFAGVAVQRMVAGGNELILGAKRDPHFGPVVMFGFGGLYTEVFEDVAFRLAPLSLAEANEMILEVRAAKILQGVRGKEPSDIASLAHAIVRLGQLIADFEDIAEIDVNPIKAFAQGKGSLAVDARIVLA
jgi:acetate---CoA ligase (ADP-forming)